jgi:AcrR family transcriptional regulator
LLAVGAARRLRREPSLALDASAMGVNKPSLYAAFGDKRALFVRTLEERARALRQAIPRRVGSR